MSEEQSDVYEKLMGAGIRFVSFRPRSRKEIEVFLTRKLTRSHTSAPLVIQRVLERLAELNYLNDDAFVSWWIGQRRGNKPKGTRLIERELREKGISKETIQKHLEEPVTGVAEPVSERDLALRAVHKKLILWKKLPPMERQKKISDYLSRRGFDWDAISSVVDDSEGKE